MKNDLKIKVLGVAEIVSNFLEKKVMKLVLKSKKMRFVYGDLY